MHALSSAAVAVAVTRACTRGELERCGCDRKVRGISPEGELDLSTLSHTEPPTAAPLLFVLLSLAGVEVPCKILITIKFSIFCDLTTTNINAFH